MLTRVDGCDDCCGARRLMLDTVSINTANTSVNSLSALQRYRKESGPRPLTSSKTNNNRSSSTTSSFHSAIETTKESFIVSAFRSERVASRFLQKIIYSMNKTNQSNRPRQIISTKASTNQNQELNWWNSYDFHLGEYLAAGG